MMKPYNHLRGYLHRWSVLKVGRLKVRIHDILTPDGTPYMHTHPFHYVSIVLSGGYTEQIYKGFHLATVKHTRWSVIARTAGRPHRISEVQPNAKTLFFCWSSRQPWKLFRFGCPAPQGYVDAPDGVYEVHNGWRARRNGFWYALRSSPEEARACGQLSIHQTGENVSIISGPIGDTSCQES